MAIASETQSRLILPAALKKQALALYNQQMWSWGQDVRHPDGNLLLRYGFTHRRHVPDKQGGSSEYLLTRDGLQLRLWSFGLTLRGFETLVLVRHAFRPRILVGPLAEEIWKTTQLPKTRPVQGFEEVCSTLGLLQSVCHMMGDYELWLGERLPATYRQQCFQRWPQRPREFVRESGRQWHQIAAALQDLKQALT